MVNAQQQGPKAGEVPMDDATKKATAKGLEWLASQQNGDGSWSGEGKYAHNTAVTSFALLAFMSQGHLPGQGRYGPEVAKGARFLIASQRPDGYLIGSRGGNMYCHGMAALTLAELWGMTGDEEIKPALEKSVDLIVRCQNRDGGWRYDPAPTGADISVTIMQVMALRAAKNSGLHVPDNTLKRALEYIDSCHDSRSGGYNYQPGRSDPGFARTAAGVCVLQLAGQYDAMQIARAVEFLERLGEERRHFWYGQYYAAHALHQIGGKKWEEWYTKVRSRLLSKQQASGAWPGGYETRGAGGSDDGVGPIYTTSISVIVLSVPMNYLPIFQN